MDPYTEPHWTTSALVTIDTQRDVLAGGALEVPGTSWVLPAMRRAVTAARESTRPIVHVVRLYRPDGSNADLCRRDRLERGWEALAPGRPGSELAEDLLPHPDVRLDHSALLAGRAQSIGPDEAVLYKPRWGAFYRTPLEAHLRSRGIDTIVFCGCNYPNCPRASIYEASERDFRVVALEDAISGFDRRATAELLAIGASACTAEEYASATTSDHGSPA